MLSISSPDNLNNKNENIPDRLQQTLLDYIKDGGSPVDLIKYLETINPDILKRSKEISTQLVDFCKDNQFLPFEIRKRWGFEFQTSETTPDDIGREVYLFCEKIEKSINKGELVANILLLKQFLTSLDEFNPKIKEIKDSLLSKLETIQIG